MRVDLKQGAAVITGNAPIAHATLLQQTNARRPPRQQGASGLSVNVGGICPENRLPFPSQSLHTLTKRPLAEGSSRKLSPPDKEMRSDTCKWPFSAM